VAHKNPPIQVISLGAGVQSSTVALMAAEGELPMPQCAVFADTFGESAETYEWLNWLEGELPYPVYRVTNGPLAERMLTVREAESGKKYMSPMIPCFIKKKDGTPGMMHRQCTSQHKIRPIQRKLKALKKEANSISVDIWLGISTDEASRMKPSQVLYVDRKYPLIDKGMNRQDCLDWMSTHGHPTPPRSSCVYCPYHSPDEWQNLKDNHPKDFAKAVVVDKELREKLLQTDIKGEGYLHRSLVPLDEVVFTGADTNMFINDCEGICGT
jgi:hypothetical protein